MNRINNHLSVLAQAVILLLLTSGCLKNDLEDEIKREQELIKQYLISNSISESTKTEGGIYYVEEVAGTGISPVKDDYVVINYVGRYVEDLTICETNDSTLRDEWAAAKYFEYYLYGPVKFRFGYSISGLNEGLSLMKEGGKARLIIPSAVGFYDWNPLVYDVELIKVIRNPVTYEDSVLTAYLNEKGFDESTKMVNDSVWFKETYTPDPSDQHVAQANDTVLFHFTGRIVDGFTDVLQDDRIFDANTIDEKPVKTVNGKIQTSSGHILALPNGLIVALDSMRSGTHATAVLPYRQAFGVNGLYDDTYGYTIVPKYQTIVYDIEVVDIRSPTGK